MRSLQGAEYKSHGTGARSNSFGATNIFPTTPASPPLQSPRSAGGRAGFGHARRRTGSIKTEQQHSPESGQEGWEDRDESRIGVKRACNECRQQKLRCDVSQDPFAPCTRCQRCKLDCRIDSNFKRVGKRKRNAEMEREIQELRQQLERQQQLASQQLAPPLPHPYGQTIVQTSSPLDQYMGSEEAVAGLLDLRSGGDGGFSSGKPPRRLENVILTSEQVDSLFDRFFEHFHPYQPLLDPNRFPDFYFETSPLLFWTVVSVAARHHEELPNLITAISGPLTRLLWATIADVPQSYHVVKALCILCVWPLPISSTSADPTFMISGLMLQIAMQIGLHRPSHAQDFSKFRVDLREEELKDRVKTWAACNVIAQRVATGYGQPPSTHYDWTLAPSGMRDAGVKLPDEMDARLRIEIFVDKVTRSLYGDSSAPLGLAPESAKMHLTKYLSRELEELEQANFSTVNKLYLGAAKMHLRLSVFFDSPDTVSYREDLSSLWLAVTTFLEQVKAYDKALVGSMHYATNYIIQMLIASGFTLLKLLNSFFANLIDFDYGKSLFTSTIQTIRAGSVLHNDLHSRLAEVLAQLWRASSVSRPPQSPKWDGVMDNTLQLKVRCRMSMSLVFDSVWRWREEFQVKGRDNLESALKNPTNPESTTSTGTEGTTSDTDALQVHSGSGLGIGGNNNNKSVGGLETMLAPPSSSGLSRGNTPGDDYGFGPWTNDVFDPLNWMLDGLVDMPYNVGGSLDAMQGV